MEGVLDLVADVIATAIELAMLLVLVIGAIEALVDTARQLLRHQKVRESIRETWLRFAAWIILALEFALAADLIRTIVTPTWDEIGMLAAIGTLRTLLSFFLGRDLEEFRHRNRREPGAA